MVLNERENIDWINDLNGEGLQQEEAIAALRQLLLRSALYTFSRSTSLMRDRDREEVLAMAEDCAQEALIAVLQKLDTFRGESRFTTWVYKFAVHKALETARREQWKGRSLEPLPEENQGSRSVEGGPGEHADPWLSSAQQEIWNLVLHVICQELTERQRLVVKLMLFEEVPMDVVTERLDTNRNAVYKMLHDARKRIRSQLHDHGYSTQEVMDLFQPAGRSQNMPFSGGNCL